MRVLVVGEGPHDVGLRNVWCERTARHVDHPGWLQVYIRKLARPGEPWEIVAIQSRQIVLTGGQRRSHMPLPEGHGAKALAARLKAEIDGFDMVIFMADADSADDREWDRHYGWIRNGFDRIADGPAAVACLPKCSSESWLLSDAEAWMQTGLDDPRDLPPRPEELSGHRHDPASNHPHRLFTRICRSAGVEDCRETRVEVAGRSDMDTVARKCPKSFVAFRRDLAQSSPSGRLP
ncbi:hypothetical protein IGS68_31685 (plasmid) [Skermanella sp. TT6]|uniref:DUF4276 family protein n=1 Tax=Skermanella cutis TaxID=2775420 RepID=A0ABX7BMC9_9PROT|nr:hypothetical protein [Skermanella sp. TT6]QQP93588.1 hypothetical protein IGS68_31685 [Skermanella sp. TT6]